VRDVLAFVHDEGLGGVAMGSLPMTVAYHDACHALRAQHIYAAPRALLRQIPDLRVLEVVDGDRCCGAAGIYAVTQPETAGVLGSQKATAVAATGASIVASANPGCSIQLAAHLRAMGHDVEVVHPIELLDRAMRQASNRSASATSDAK
jgi:glycolate oxidase iron-sulfur subunit